GLDLDLPGGVCVPKGNLRCPVVDVHPAGRRLDGERVLGPVLAEVVEKYRERADTVGDAGIRQARGELGGRLPVSVAVDVEDHELRSPEVKRRVAAGGVLPARGGQLGVAAGGVQRVAGGLDRAGAGALGSAGAGAFGAAAAAAVGAVGPGGVGSGGLGVDGPSSAGEVDGYLC